MAMTATAILQDLARVLLPAVHLPMAHPLVDLGRALQLRRRLYVWSFQRVVATVFLVNVLNSSLDGFFR